ncbi:MAG: type II toxin-antitoxin system Phd/YefM family antitoxin [Synergistaceae bacterium]|nr:type II toxin-antitoxin system Phd/YefM family antitoxin [Synergistaceae bacterium]
MTATTIKQAQKNLAGLVESINLGSEPIIIVNEEDATKNTVLISEEEFNSLRETLYLYSIPGMVESILNADDFEPYDPNEEW